jgi:Rieske Fe-S protein
LEPNRDEEKPEVPGPSLWPVGFAVGIAVLLAGLIVSWWIVAIGAVIAIVFGFLWVRDATTAYRAQPAPPPAPSRTGETPAAVAAPVAAPSIAPAADTTYSRGKVLGAATLGLGAAIGAIVSVPPGFLALIPPFLDQGRDEVDFGPLDEYPEGEWRIVTFLERPEQGEVSRRTVYIRNNGLLEGQPSFTIISNRCAHLGCPVQPNALVDEEHATRPKVAPGSELRIIPAQGVSGFGCPCHGGQYDSEGNRTAGPPVRALDRLEFAIRKQRLWGGDPYSVSTVDGTGASAMIHKYRWTGPGQHVDGVEQILYPFQPPNQ